MATLGPPARPALSPELVKRVISAVVLAPLAIGAAFLGGFVWLALATGAALLIAFEWDDLTQAGARGAALAAMVAGVIAAALALALGWTSLAIAGFAAVFALALALALIPHGRAGAAVWALRGLAYALAFLVPVAVLRGSAALGFEAILFLFVVIWTTDVAAFFSGRALGGPKLCPSISPKKTWAGFLGGSGGGMLAGVGFALWLGTSVGAAALVALALSLLGHAGDLFESWIKRHFDKKDSGDLIPGHGGAMDRIDSFIFAAAAALAIGVLRSGPWDAARGLLMW